MTNEYKHELSAVQADLDNIEIDFINIVLNVALLFILDFNQNPAAVRSLEGMSACPVCMHSRTFFDSTEPNQCRQQYYLP